MCWLNTPSPQNQLPAASVMIHDLLSAPTLHGPSPQGPIEISSSYPLVGYKNFVRSALDSPRSDHTAEGVKTGISPIVPSINSILCPMKIVSCFCVAVTLLATVSTAQTATTLTPPTAAHHHKKAKHNHTVRHKGKRKHSRTPAAPSAATVQPEAAAPATQSHI